jgi:hypothetical protein
VSDWNTKTRDGFEISVYQCTEWRSGGKVQTRYFISANELKTKINANTKYGFKTAGEKQTIYFSGIMQVYYASSGKNGSELLRSASALGKYFGKTASAYAAHYNVQYTWKFKSPVYKTLQVHYIVKNSRSEDLPNGKTLDSYVELNDVKANSVQSISGKIKYNKEKSTKTVYQDIIEKNGKTYAISGFYFLTYSNKSAGKFTMLSENTHLYFEYVEVKEPEQTINIEYQYQAYEDGKYVWKTVDTEKITNYKKDTYKRLLFRVSNTYAKTGNL